MIIYVCAIEELPNLKKNINVEDGLTGYVTLTTRYYTSTLHLEPHINIKCQDVYKYKDGFINNYQIDALYDFLKTYSMMERLIVMCDAGLSRSPSVAIALYDYYGNHSKVHRWKEYFRWYNHDMYEVIKNRFKELEKRNKK